MVSPINDDFRIIYIIVIYMTFSAQFGMALVDASLGNDYINLFDMRTETCVEARQTLMTVERPYLELLIPRVQDTAALTVYFNQTIDCQQRKVSYSSTE